jgi:hypothetical protein
MYVDFNDLPDTARIWVYQSDRELTTTQIEDMRKTLKDFVNDWTRHGQDLKGSFAILHNHFIVIGVDEGFNEVSGCSIDASTHVFKRFEQQFGIDLFNKLNTAFRSGDHINVVSMSDFQKFVKDERISQDTVVFNNMVQTKAELAHSWEVPATQSWHSRYFNS